MKKTIIPFILFTFMVLTPTGAQVSLVWENNALARTPESIVYDNIRDCCYISNFNKSNGDGMTYNEDYISKFNLKGELLESKMIPNLSSPTGLCLLDDKLYIVERFGIVKYDLKQNKVETRYRIKSGKFLNDVAVDSKGNIYVTVSDTNIIYRIKERKVEKWLESPEIMNPNGIIVDGDKIIVGVCSVNTVKSITIEDKKISTIAKLGPGSGVIDGIQKYGDNYLITHFEGDILLLHSDGKVEELLNNRGKEVSYADFGFIEGQQLLVIPDLNFNKVLLYKLDISK